MRPEGHQREGKGDGVSSEETRDHEGDRAGPRSGGGEGMRVVKRIEYPVCKAERETKKVCGNGRRWGMYKEWERGRQKGRGWK